METNFVPNDYKPLFLLIILSVHTNVPVIIAFMSLKGQIRGSRQYPHKKEKAKGPNPVCTVRLLFN